MRYFAYLSSFSFFLLGFLLGLVQRYRHSSNPFDCGCLICVNEKIERIEFRLTWVLFYESSQTNWVCERDNRPGEILEFCLNRLLVLRVFRSRLGSSIFLQGVESCVNVAYRTSESRAQGDRRDRCCVVFE